jgi:hypothetical protein
MRDAGAGIRRGLFLITALSAISFVLIEANLAERPPDLSVKIASAPLLTSNGLYEFSVVVSNQCRSFALCTLELEKNSVKDAKNPYYSGWIENIGPGETFTKLAQADFAVGPRDRVVVEYVRRPGKVVDKLIQTSALWPFLKFLIPAPHTGAARSEWFDTPSTVGRTNNQHL